MFVPVFWLSFTANLARNQAVAALQTAREYRVRERLDYVPAQYGGLSGKAQLKGFESSSQTISSKDISPAPRNNR